MQALEFGIAEEGSSVPLNPGGRAQPWKAWKVETRHGNPPDPR
jgi:hypothetical protein